MRMRKSDGGGGVKDILLFCNVERQGQMLRKAWKMAGMPEGISGGVHLFDSASALTPEMRRGISEVAAVFAFWQGTIYATDMTEAIRKVREKTDAPFAFLGSASAEGTCAQGLTSEQMDTLRQYLQYGGIKNYRRLWRYIAREILGAAVTAKPPAPLPWSGIYDPGTDQVFDSLAAYQAYRPRRAGESAVALIFSRESWVWRDTAYLDAIIRHLAGAGLYPIPVFALWADNPLAKVEGISRLGERYFFEHGVCVLDAIVNTFKVGLTVSSQNDRDFFRQLNVPVIQAYNLLRPYDEWVENLMGLTPVELSCNVVEPEFDGVIHGVPVSSKERDAEGYVYYKPMEKRIRFLAAKVKKWCRLRRKENAEKKIAIIFHNYPPDNSTVGSAQGLDSPASVALLLRAMKAAGYTIDHVPENGKELMTGLLAGITNDRRFLTERDAAQAVGQVAREEYAAHFDSFAPRTQEELTAAWGEAPGTVFLYNDRLIVPGTINGNVLITMQPPRGFGEDKAKILHDPASPPPHHYLAYYAWIRDQWQADAVIHVGTHGSLEWLPGKNAGLSHLCYPELALGDLPDIYPYYVTIVGEGIQAKRRGAACLIGHLNPPQSRAETYDELAELELLVEEYAHFKVGQPESTGVVAARIREKVAALHLEEDIPPQDEEDEDDYILRIHAYLSKLKHMEIRAGLHILGEPPEGQALTEAISALTRTECGGASGEKAIPALPQVMAQAKGFDYYALEEKSGEILPGTDKSGAMLLDEIWQTAEEWIEYLRQRDFSPTAIEALLSSASVTAWAEDAAAEGFRRDLARVLRFIAAVIAPNLGKTRQEMTNTLRALDGEYIEPGPGGSPTSGRIDILPTGRNFFGVSPDTLPTPIAWELGVELAEQAVSRFIAEEGHYPESVGIVLWSDSNMRTNGQCIAEFLYLIGVRPVWQRGSRRVIGLEVLPLEELRRPRIDVTARISGLFRDTLHVAVEWLEKAVQMVADLSESSEENYIKKHVEEDTAALMAAGQDGETARRQAMYRMFGCPPGGYGAGVGHLIEEKNWENIHDIADVYVRWGAHVYGSENAGDFLPDLFRRRLSNVEVTIKNMDNHEIHLLNSDDFNAYCGGMNAAVHSLRGKAPRCYIGDTADRARAETKSLDEEFRRVYRGESMNPKYLEGMKKHGYKGASDLAGIVAHAYAWDCTSEVMTDWMYDGFAEKYALDKDMQAWMRDVNPWALQRIAGKLLEAEKRQMWSPSAKVKEELQRLYLDLEGDLESRGDAADEEISVASPRKE